MRNTRKRMEQDGLYLSTADHWELLENQTIYIYHLLTTNSHINIPKDVIQHLKLKNKDKVTIAIRRAEK